MSAPDENGWFSIETAPEVIGYYVVWFEAQDGYLAKASAARWNGYHWTDSGYRTDEGHEPTHWQPLPPPPITNSLSSTHPAMTKPAGSHPSQPAGTPSKGAA